MPELPRAEALAQSRALADLPKCHPSEYRTRGQWEAFEAFGRAIVAPPWRVATTARKNPHAYTLAKEWPGGRPDFEEAVRFIYRTGYTMDFGGWPYVVVPVNEYRYWTMSYPPGETTLINRARDRVATPYDRIADRYDTLFRTVDAWEDEAAVLRRVGRAAGVPLDRASVLDVGCGTGMVLSHASPARYLGVDPSAGMLRELRHRHPAAPVVATTLERFVGPAAPPDPAPGGPPCERYDVLLATFGVGSYLSDAELSRVPHLLAPGGVAVLSFYDAAYDPDTYARTRHSAPHRPYTPGAVDVLMASGFCAGVAVDVDPDSDARYVTLTVSVA